jgi:thymidylate synthase (FAD)
MKLIKQNFEILSQENNLEGIYKQIEIAGRTCYKSEDKITEDSSIKFVQMLIDRGHTAMLEHGTVYLIIAKSEVKFNEYRFYQKNKYSKVFEDENHFYITTNFRVINEYKREEDLKYLTFPFKYHEKRVAVRFICDRSISHELVRHRVFSFAQESTRYCNYSKNQFGNELTFIIPCWILENEFFRDNDFSIETNIKDVFTGGDYSDLYSYFKILQEIENSYFKLLDYKWQPQQARAILPNSLKTEIIMTGFVSDWKHFFGLRCDKAAHPQMRELAIPLQEEFIKLNLI